MGSHSKTSVLPILFAGLAMSLGWGIRGNFGHELGAMVPGALIGLAVALNVNREDWLNRWPLFGLFGAVGWAFGGQMSYGIVIGYTRAGQFGSVLYGYAGLFLIGGLWAATGMAILLIPALWSRKKVQELFVPFLVILAIWAIQDLVFIHFFGDTEPDILDYFDTDWVPATTALLGILGVALVQKKISNALSFFLHLTLGWFAGVLILVTILGLHLSPPRSDNWAGMVGLVTGLVLYFWRKKEKRVLWAMTGAFLFGGIGFSIGDLFQTLGSTTGISLDWWKIMEETFGLITGLGVAWLFGILHFAIGRTEEDEPEAHWVTGFSLYFLGVLLFYMLFNRSFDNLLSRHLVPAAVYGLSSKIWFELAFLLFWIVALILLRTLLREKRPYLPVSRLGRLQVFSILFIWASLLLDAALHFYPFGPSSITVQGYFFVAALLLTVYIGLFDQPMRMPESNHSVALRWKPLIFALLLLIPTLLLTETWLSVLSHPSDLPGAHDRFGLLIQRKPAPSLAIQTQVVRKRKSVQSLKFGEKIHFEKREKSIILD